jgi:S1-C subfamily serine protease
MVDRPAKLTAMPRNRHHYPEWVAMGAAIVGTLLGGLAVYLGLNFPEQSLAGAVGTPEVGVDAPAEAPIKEITPSPLAEKPQASIRTPAESLADAVERTMPTVVSIKVSGRVHGAGVIYDQSGLLLTNFHVVESVLSRSSLGAKSSEAEPITAQLGNGRELPARVVAADGDEDIAVLKLVPADSAESFAAASLGESSRLRIGDGVFAIGSPVGLQHTVSTGIVSALDRTDILPKRQLPLIQLDASINVGNSGGPLFNYQGELVGITVARSHRAQGIGFAIPIDHVDAVLRALQKGEAERSGVIGVELTTEATEKEIKAHGYSIGLQVASVYPGPAKTAGMEVGDIVVEIRGKRYDELGDGPEARGEFLRHFGQVVRSVVPGETLSLTVVRGSEVKQLEVEVAAASDARQAMIDCEEILGLVLEESEDVPTIGRVAAGSEVSRYRGNEALRGTVITHILGQKVGSVTEAGKVLGDIKNWAQSGPGRTISVRFRTASGDPFTVSNFPLTVGN